MWCQIFERKSAPNLGDWVYLIKYWATSFVLSKSFYETTWAFWFNTKNILLDLIFHWKLSEKNHKCFEIFQNHSIGQKPYSIVYIRGTVRGQLQLKQLLALLGERSGTFRDSETEHGDIPGLT